MKWLLGNANILTNIFSSNEAYISISMEISANTAAAYGRARHLRINFPYEIVASEVFVLFVFTNSRSHLFYFYKYST